MAMSYIKAYYDWERSTSTLTDEELGRLVRCLFRYAHSGELPETQGPERYLLPVFCGQIDRDRENYAQICEKRRQAGRKGGLSGRRKQQESSEESEEEHMGANAGTWIANANTWEAQDANADLCHQKTQQNTAVLPEDFVQNSIEMPVKPQETDQKQTKSYDMLWSLPWEGEPANACNWNQDKEKEEDKEKDKEEEKRIIHQATGTQPSRPEAHETKTSKAPLRFGFSFGLDIEHTLHKTDTLQTPKAPLKSDGSLGLDTEHSSYKPDTFSHLLEQCKTYFGSKPSKGWREKLYRQWQKKGSGACLEALNRTRQYKGKHWGYLYTVLEQMEQERSA